MALETNLIHNWRLNGNSNDNKGSYNGTDTSMSYVAGKMGAMCGDFNGSSSRIALTSTDFPTGNATGTISFWFKTTSSDSDGTIVFAYGTNSAQASLFCGANATQPTKFGGGPWGDYTYANSATNNGAWHFYVLAFTAGVYNLYIDGSLQALSPDTMATNLTTGNGYIGYDFTGGFYALTSLQEISFWSREISAAEVTTLYNYGVGSYFNGTIFVAYAPTITTNYLKYYAGKRALE